ncbi:hypothetical protein BC826DRAFT_970644 [Russula brevipes]|nr:hypothetical protein BC826DRAFT_970644 [Russula brevipes]
MSATLTGPTVIENVRPVEGSRCVVLDTQIYVSPDQALTGRFHFFNTAGIRFDDVGHYLGTLSRAVPSAIRNHVSGNGPRNLRAIRKGGGEKRSTNVHPGEVVADVAEPHPSGVEEVKAASKGLFGRKPTSARRERRNPANPRPAARSDEKRKRGSTTKNQETAQARKGSEGAVPVAVDSSIGAEMQLGRIGGIPCRRRERSARGKGNERNGCGERFMHEEVATRDAEECGGPQMNHAVGPPPVRGAKQGGNIPKRKTQGARVVNMRSSNQKADDEWQYIYEGCGMVIEDGEKMATIAPETAAATAKGKGKTGEDAVDRANE